MERATARGGDPREPLKRRLRADRRRGAEACVRPAPVTRRGGPPRQTQAAHASGSVGSRAEGDRRPGAPHPPRLPTRTETDPKMPMLSVASSTGIDACSAPLSSRSIPIRSGAGHCDDVGAHGLIGIPAGGRGGSRRLRRLPDARHSPQTLHAGLFSTSPRRGLATENSVVSSVRHFCLPFTLTRA